jgi:hypothetical protein
MTDLTDTDIAKIAKALAPVLVKNIRDEHHEFWLDTEKHYRDHLTLGRLDEVFTDEMLMALKEVARSYKTGRNLLWRMFIGLVALGALALAFQGWWHGKPPGP